MRHLRVLSMVLIGALLAAGCSTLGSALLGNQVAFTAPQLQHYLDKRFPRDYDKLGGMVTLTVFDPRLSIPRDSNRLRLDFDVGFAALGGDSHKPSGHFAVASGLRFDPATRGLLLDRPAIESVDIPALGGIMNASGRALIDRWLDDYARNEPVYRFDDRLLQRLGSRRIGSTTIENGEVVVHLQ